LVAFEDDCSGGGTAGDTHWLVHQNLGDSFGEGLFWNLPPLGYATAYERPNNAASCGLGATAWRTLDITGDRIVDLVLTFDACSMEAGLGDTHYRVYPGSIVTD
jgi:hypothetical protein